MDGLKEGKKGNIKIANNDHDTIQDLMGGLNERQTQEFSRKIYDSQQSKQQQPITYNVKLNYAGTQDHVVKSVKKDASQRPMKVISITNTDRKVVEEEPVKEDKKETKKKAPSNRQIEISKPPTFKAIGEPH